MLKKYRNAVFDLIRAANLDPQLFTSTQRKIEDYDAFRVRVKNSRLYFTVGTSLQSGKREFSCAYSEYERADPRPYIDDVDLGFLTWGEFASIEKEFNQWLVLVRMYLEDKAEEAEDQTLPDLWSDLKQSSGTVGKFQALQNTSFSLEEQRRIAETLNKFKEEVQKREILSGEQVRLLNEQIEYLVKSSKYLGRKDWLNVTLGALIGFTLQAALATDAAMQIIRLAGEALRWIARNPPLLP